jgi:hypothetical protein
MSARIAFRPRDDCDEHVDIPDEIARLRCPMCAYLLGRRDGAELERLRARLERLELELTTRGGDGQGA